jgi:hypothetical protein
MGLKMKIVYTGILFILISCSIVFADSWYLKPLLKDSEYLFGDTRIVSRYDSTQSPVTPKFTLFIYNNKKLVQEYEDIGFEELFASDDNKYFLAVSNDGLINPAFAIFDNEGNILKIQLHNSRDFNYNYCKTSTTIIRVWYDPKNPKIEFNIFHGKLLSVSIKGCDGKRVFLLN